MKTISERAQELWEAGQGTDFYGRKWDAISQEEALRRAIDEWQVSETGRRAAWEASVEAALREAGKWFELLQKSPVIGAQLASSADRKLKEGL